MILQWSPICYNGYTFVIMRNYSDSIRLGCLLPYFIEIFIARIREIKDGCNGRLLPRISVPFLVDYYERSRLCCIGKSCFENIPATISYVLKPILWPIKNDRLWNSYRNQWHCSRNPSYQLVHWTYSNHLSHPKILYTYLHQ